MLVVQSRDQTSTLSLTLRNNGAWVRITASVSRIRRIAARTIGGSSSLRWFTCIINAKCLPDEWSASYPHIQGTHHAHGHPLQIFGMRLQTQSWTIIQQFLKGHPVDILQDVRRNGGIVGVTKFCHQSTSTIEGQVTNTAHPIESVKFVDERIVISLPKQKATALAQDIGHVS